MATARAGKPAHTEITDGLLVALGGVLIMLPGFVSDIAGLLLLLPSRSLFRRGWLRKAERDAQRHGVGSPMGSAMGGAVFGTRSGPHDAGQPRTIVVDSEVVDTSGSTGTAGNSGSAGNTGASTDSSRLGPGHPGFGMSK